MIHLTGACDTETFAVNALVGNPYRSGIQTTSTLRRHGVTDGWVVRVSTPFVRLWNQGIQGNVAMWDYIGVGDDPFLWVVYNSDNSINQMWESENKPDILVDRDQAPIVFDSPHDVVPSGGGTVEALLPLQSDMETIEASVVALGTTLPTWTTNTKYENTAAHRMANTTVLMKHLFMDKQKQRSMKPLEDLTALNNYKLDPINYNRYNLLWLRSASQILYNHRAETLIPLVEDLMQVNSSTKYLSII